ncbi:MAG: HAD family hydrolase [Alphaproteobacteria bacterium]|nr:HAD family hydrolase [Alphaproteobacteria bacterium]
MNDAPVKRLAMWSGPRNISTAMMRAFEHRPDCAVWDEPFYAAYLSHSGVVHPMQPEIIADGMPNPQEVVEGLLGATPDGEPLFYQKHMSHHMIAEMPRGWFSQVTHGFLLRHPEKVTASYAAKRAEVTLEDIGFPQLVEIFDQVCDMTGKAPPVLDSDEVPAQPRACLSALCEAWDIPFTEAMLSWPAGKRDSDGIWADWWYGQVWQSTGFQAGAPKQISLTADHQKVADAAMPHYERMRQHLLEDQAS